MKLKEQQIFSSNIVSDVHPSIRLSKREEKKRKKKKNWDVGLSLKNEWVSL